MSKGQTWIEFIIATSVFLFVVGFLFFFSAGNFREEAENVQFQTNCLKTDALENLLKQPGIPANWDSTGSASVFGLSSENLTKVIPIRKWLIAKSLGYAAISENSTPGDSWRIDYSVYAFEPANSTPCRYGDAITICRSPGWVNVTANTTQVTGATIDLTLFFPLINANVTTNSLESSDSNVTRHNVGGTEIAMKLKISAPDQDVVNITTFNSPVELIFVRKAFIDSPQDLTFLLGNTSMQDSFGSATVDARNLCSKKVRAAINLTNESMLADFDLIAW